MLARRETGIDKTLTWFTAGACSHVLEISWMSSSRKLDTPTDRARPSFLICSIADQAFERSSGTRGEWMRSGVSEVKADPRTRTLGYS